MSNTNIDIEALKARYTAAGQSHLFSHWDKLTSAQEQTFASQLDKIDVERVNAVYKTAMQAKTEAKSSSASTTQNNILPPPKQSLLDTVPGSQGLQSAREAGLRAIAQGKVALVLMAGGQGTRLGSSAPKGTYDIELPSHKSLFQLQAERIIRLTQLAAQEGERGSANSPPQSLNNLPATKTDDPAPASATMTRDGRSITTEGVGGHCPGGCPPPGINSLAFQATARGGITTEGTGGNCPGGCPPPGLYGRTLQPQTAAPARSFTSSSSSRATSPLDDSALLRPAKRQRTLSNGNSSGDTSSLFAFTPATSYTSGSDQGYVGQASSATIPCFIMTSEFNHQSTVDFFKSNKFFGLQPENVIFFRQGSMPCLTEDGKIILGADGEILTAPDGDGGLYTALRTPLADASSQSPLALMRSRGIEYIHACAVDNCLVRVADPVLIGGCIKREAKIGVKVVTKIDPAEESGRANAASYFFTLDFLETEVPRFETQLVFHIARKFIPISAPSTFAGEPIGTPASSGIELELSAYDVCPFVDPARIAVQEVARQEEFSPLKNGIEAGSDGLETARRDLLALQKTWLESVEGVQIADGVEVEISPLISYAGEGLEQYNGRKFTENIILEL
ncbi:hypothetical protein CF327_g18 [Tilletia walkeri]|uniref:UDP-N-acetylglucosamine diphosphorylase n=1 Tax=Tilletia walkeri TaxID=117179 RepID=A0A8X7NEM4_9BASI|nr:hypothetical protein CF327_g18 [Tilletia walkeri]KAE8272287.1 hypothetical protein A4X09_0g74 [Tilletia walkeri]